MEKGPVLPDRSAERTPILVAPEGWQAEIRSRGSRGIVEEIAGIERAVAQKFKERTVEAVGSPFAHQGHLGAHPHAVFGADGIGDHPPLPNPFDPQRTVATRSSIAGEHIA